MSKRDTPRPPRAQLARPVSPLEENVMLSESVSRPSIPVIDVLRASQAELLEVASEHLSSPELRAQTRKLLRRLDSWAALAVVLLATSAVFYLGTLMIERWQLR
jgi:hypothetical protein